MNKTTNCSKKRKYLECHNFRNDKKNKNLELRRQNNSLWCYFVFINYLIVIQNIFYITYSILM